MQEQQEVWITGIGILSSLGEGVEAHWQALTADKPQPVVENEQFAPYPVHPLPEVDFSRQIPKKSDLRQMEPWQRIGVYAAGLALADAGIAGNEKYLQQTNLLVAAGSGERDSDVDRQVLEKLGARSDDDADILASEILPSALRPTLFLAQLSNLLAGNISIVHKVTASSRTFMGEESAGISIMENAFRRITSGQGDIFLVGAASNAERKDLMLTFELGHKLWHGEAKPVWQRDDSGGMILGSMGVFLVLESAKSARERGAKPYARLSNIAADRSSRAPGDAAEVSGIMLKTIPLSSHSPLAVISGTSGITAQAIEEREFINKIASKTAIRALGTMLGHGVEAQFPAGIALAAMALNKGQFYPPFDASGTEQPFTGNLQQALVTCWGNWRGEGLALVEAV